MTDIAVVSMSTDTRPIALTMAIHCTLYFTLSSKSATLALINPLPPVDE